MHKWSREDLRAVAKVLEGRKIASHVRGIIVLV